MNEYKDTIKVGIEKCKNIRGAALRREISGFDLMVQTTQIARDMVKNEFLRNAPQKGMAVFVFGSISRNEMLTYSDIDMIFVGTVSESVASVAIENMMKALGYGFGKVDHLEGYRKRTIKRFAKYSLTDRNKIIPAQFIAGDSSILDWMNNLQARENTLDYAIKNIVFQKHYLKDFYGHKGTEEVPNVKYHDGGTYDLLMYNWFDNVISLYRGNNWMHEPESDRPKIESSLKNMTNNGILSSAEHERVKVAAEFMFLLRNEILHLNQNTKDEDTSCLDKATQNRVFESAYPFFKSQGINTHTELRRAYEGHRDIIYSTKAHLLQTLLGEEAKRKGDTWKRLFDAAEKGELSRLTGDPVIDIAAIWGLNYAGDKRGFNTVSEQAKWNWEVCASIACSNLANPEILERIRSYARSRLELSYILRIIARNPNSTKETVTKIAED
jgi:predicted nucleotidyltransferase